MQQIRRRVVLGIGMALAGAAFAGNGFAQSYPTKPIRLVVPYPPGGGTDFFARTVAAKMSEDLGQQIIVENKPGASTMIGAESVAKSSAPDGYSVLLGDNATYAVNPSLYKKMPYDPLKDLAPVTLTARFALLLVVHPSVPVNTVQEFVALAKSQPGQLNFGSPGPGSPHHLAMELFEQRAGIDLTHVPYKGGAPATQDLLGGRIPTMFLDLATAAPHIKAGKLRALAVANATRLASMPDLPTVAELGYAGYEATAWQGFTVPAGTPAPIIARLNAAYAKAAADQSVRQRLNEAGAELIPSSPEALAAFMRSETAKWAKTIKDGNITVE